MPNQYEIPAYGTASDHLLPWLLEAVSEGESWLSQQRPTIEWDKVIDSLSASNPGAEINGLSNTGYDLVGRNLREIVASLSNFKHEGEFKARWDKELYKSGHVLTKLDRNWYEEAFAHEALRAGIQLGAVKGTGYWYETWDAEFWGNHGDIALESIDPGDVMFLQLPRTHDIQRAYGVLIREELPINLARSKYKALAGRIVPDRDSPGWIQKGLQAVQRMMGGSPALRVGGQSKKQRASFPTVDVFTLYTMDRAVNSSSQAMKMGATGTNWSYSVPALGDPIGMGMTNPGTGGEWTRPAEPGDCKLFPLRRQTIFTRTAVAYDGTSPWWHGQVPLARLRFNDWQWEALGRSLAGDVRTMQDGIIAIMRYIEDACAARLDPAAVFNENAVSEDFAKKFNPRMAGVRAAANLDTGGDLIKFPVPVDHYKVDAFIPEFIAKQEERINKQMGTPDLVAVAKAKQVPSSDAQEKLLEMAGPLVQDMMRALVIPQRQLGEWRKAYYFQFYTRGRVIQTAGPEGDDEQDFQYQPSLIVPTVEGETSQQRQDRSKRYLSEYKFRLTKTAINDMYKMTAKLSILQLMKHIPIDRWTVAEMWEIPNYGPKPEGTNNVMERVRAENAMKQEEAVEMQQAMEGAGAGPGRPGSGKKPPHIVSKDGGTRSTIAQS